MTRLLAFEWRRMRSLRDTWVLLGLVGFALLADLAVGLGNFKEPMAAEGLAFQVVQRDLIIRWLVAAAIGAQAFGHDLGWAATATAAVHLPNLSAPEPHR